MVSTRTVLVMRFTRKHEPHKLVSLRLPDPKDDITDEDVKDVMDYIVDNELFGNKIGGIKDAKIVTTTEKEYDVIALSDN